MSKVSPSQIKQLNVVIGEFNDEPVYIRTNVIGDQSKPFLVLMHGYASSGALFFKVMKQLIKYFCMVFIDIIGMGGSSRPDDFDKDNLTPQQSIDYFVNSVEKWR
jgi:pimeloyl-ACP methyl ester carboxylesterase